MQAPPTQQQPAAQQQQDDATTPGHKNLPPPLLPVVMEGPPPAEYDVVERSLRMFMDKEVPLESDEELAKRQKIMERLARLFQTWVQDVCRRKGCSEEAAKGAGGKLYTSGSYRLRVHEPGADIDSVGVAPKYCERADFFSSLKEALLQEDTVENLRSIETAAVPIMTFDMEGVNIDMLFAKLPVNAVPDSTDVDVDDVLRAVDASTEKSLNGPRVTNLIFKLVEHNYESFLAVLRVTRIWAKRRGIYSNKHGYLGGVNFNILVGIVCQLFPRATPAFLLEKFFELFANWNWETTPAMLCRPVVHKNLEFEVWGQTHLPGRTAQMMFKRNNIMPIITPAFPAMNSAANVNTWTFDVLRGEFERAHDVCKDIVHQHKSSSRRFVPSEKKRLAKLWGRLVEPTDFFANYDAYLAVRVVGPKSSLDGSGKTTTGHDHLNDDLNDDDLNEDLENAPPPGDKSSSASSFEDFKGFVSSRLRKLVERLGNLPFSVVHLLPREFEDVDSDPAKVAARFYLGVEPDESRLKQGEALVLTHVWTQFWRDDICRSNSKIPPDDLDVKLEYLKWKDLPLDVFDNSEKQRADVRRKRRKRRARLRSEAAAAQDSSLENVVAEKKDDDKPDVDVAPPPEKKRRRLDDDDLALDALDDDDDDDEPPVYSLDNLPQDTPRLGPVLPKWHPLARDSRYPVKSLDIRLVKVDDLPLRKTPSDVDIPRGVVDVAAGVVPDLPRGVVPPPLLVEAAAAPPTIVA
mmetsp:Transcript_8907/g.27404  ORF Transcript_8907/g.27404 Transcript_8907/m.27404 type:complete len:745 (+) Transcript_8907:93-2327(+)